MRLTFKLVTWFLLSVIVVVGVNGYLGVRSEVARYQTELAQHHAVMGRVLRDAFSVTVQTEGEARAVSMLNYADKRTRQVDIRWVALEAPPWAVGMGMPEAPLTVLHPLLADHDVHYFDTKHNRLLSYVAVRVEGRKISALEFAESYEGIGTVMNRAVAKELAAVVAIAIAAGLAAALLGVALVGRPVQQLVEHARRVGMGDLSSRTPVVKSGELGELSQEMNLMCVQLVEAQNTRLKALEQLRHAERLTTVGKLASGLAHELGTPLNVIILRAKSIASGKATGEAAKESATSIAEQATRMTHLVRQLLEFARRRPPERSTVNLEQVVAKTADFLNTLFAKARVRIEMSRSAPSDVVRGDASQLQQLVTNIFVNAVQAMPDGGVIDVAIDDVEAIPPADLATTARQTFLRTRIRDEGTGISDDALPHIFEPFFTTKAIGEGTGLGLSVCYGIARDHNGWIEVDSHVGHGATFSIFLPKEVT